MGFIPWEIRVAFSGESQLWQSCATQTAVHAWCLSVHNPLNSDTGSLSCAHTCHCTWECTGSIRESALKVDSLRKIPCHTGQSNLHRQRASPVQCSANWATSPTITLSPPLFSSSLEVRKHLYLTVLCMQSSSSILCSSPVPIQVRAALCHLSVITR